MPRSAIQHTDVFTSNPFRTCTLFPYSSCAMDLVVSFLEERSGAFQPISPVVQGQQVLSVEEQKIDSHITANSKLASNAT